MELHDAKKLAEVLLLEHGLDDWKFEWDGAVRRFGMCSYKLKTIFLSIKLTALNSEEQVRDTILHEIAHALVGPAAGHGPLWKATAARIGANPARCYGRNVTTPPKPWRGTCPACGTVVLRHRRLKIACSRCCAGVFDARFLFVWERAVEEVTC